MISSRGQGTVVLALEADLNTDRGGSREEELLDAHEGRTALREERLVERRGEPGIYRFKAKLSMQGRWRLSLAAKVQGETGTVDDQLIVQAAK